MIRIINYKKPLPFDCECVYITEDINLSTDDYFGEEIEIISDETYNITLDASFPLDQELTAE